MGNSEETTPSKAEKPSSPPRDQTNVPVYPDWAAMQAYYGPRFAVPPYFNSAAASGHAPHPYMWGTQPMMPPYGAPYAAIYTHGAVYAHPGLGVPLAASPNMETPTKSSGNTDQSLMKKLKGFDGLAMSIGNGNGEDGANHVHSQSTETEASSDASNSNTAGASQNGRKRNHKETPLIGEDGGKTQSQNSLPVGDISALELKNSLNAKASLTNVSQPSAVMPDEAWLQNERELKRERRKQSNRESARRSRLRKQAETEELAVKVESLAAENLTLKSEINQLTENSEKLKLENATLMEKLKHPQGVQIEHHVNSTKVEKKTPPVGTENLLSRVDFSGSIDRSGDAGSEVYEKNSSSGAKLRQLLDASPRADAVAAGC